MPRGNNVIKVGDRAPLFALSTSEGREVRLADVLGTRAMVLVFLRGTW